MQNASKNYYQILNVPTDASPEEIKKAYYSLAKIYHPDCGGSEEDFKKLYTAYKTLYDKSTRAQYDQQSSNTQTTRQKYITCVFNIYTQNIRTLTLEIDTKQFPPHIFASNNTYYAIERTIDGKTVYQIYSQAEWNSQINTLKKLIKKHSVIYKIKEVLITLFIKLLPLILGVAVLALISMCDAGTNNTSTSTNTPQIQKEISSKDYIAQPVPEHGTISNSNLNYYSSSILEIKLPQGDNKTYYYIKLVEPDTNKAVQTVFMHPGTTIEIDVPCGNYKLKYSCGKEWYGYEDLFGPHGGYSQSDKIFDFTFEYGHTITLYPVTNGNLQTEDIPYSEF